MQFSYKSLPEPLSLKYDCKENKCRFLNCFDESYWECIQTTSIKPIKDDNLKKENIDYKRKHISLSLLTLGEKIKEFNIKLKTEVIVDVDCFLPLKKLPSPQDWNFIHIHGYKVKILKISKPIYKNGFITNNTRDSIDFRGERINDE